MNLPIENEKDREIAALKEELRRVKLKQTRKLRNKDPAQFLHPRDDVVFQRIRKAKKFRHTTGLAAAILKHGGRQILQSHYDPGPAPEGLVNCPALTFEKDIERVAERYGVEIPQGLIQEAAQAIEKRVDSRFHTTEDRFRRAINSAAFLAWSREGGTEPAYWGLNSAPEGSSEASEEEEESTDGTDATGQTFYEADNSPDAEDECPPEYYETRDDGGNEDWDDEPSREDDGDDSVDDDDESLDGTVDETSDDDDEEDDDQ